ncbi:MAG: 3-isopropylmalate dehydrogenase [Capnocytophaga sp.]|nr:3-isopropylmalate dehydrogenase [Capnocytophaga sp.]
MKKEYKIAVLAGDGIGPEVVDQSLKVLDAVADKYSVHFNYRKAPVGAIAIKETGSPLPEETLDVCKTSDAVLFGAIGDPEFDNNPDAKVRPEQGLLKLRKELGLYANIRPIKAFNSVAAHSPLKFDIVKDTDMVIYRELISGIYFGEKFTAEDGSYAYDICKYQRDEIERIAHLAFKAAQKRKHKVTLIDKANVLDSSRLWRKVTTEIAKEYTDVALDFLFVDNAAMQMILNPKQFDVILTENMFGDIISDEGSVIGGSIGLLPSASVGTGSALFEPIHGSFPQGKGKGIANPIASILSTAMMLEHLHIDDAANKVRKAVDQCIAQGVVTPDLKGKKTYTTTEVGDYIVDFVLNAEDSDNYCYFNFENFQQGRSTIV